mmetsp:Transcript_25007/g.98761  ORF Transcript_25007/g.98761 Transcript_25007/m.98761 type:complete len:230 (+) Transcript_25007:1328-2017(+)
MLATSTLPSPFPCMGSSTGRKMVGELDPASAADGSRNYTFPPTGEVMSTPLVRGGVRRSMVLICSTFAFAWRISDLIFSRTARSLCNSSCASLSFFSAAAKCIAPEFSSSRSSVSMSFCFVFSASCFLLIASKLEQVPSKSVLSAWQCALSSRSFSSWASSDLFSSSMALIRFEFAPIVAFASLSNFVFSAERRSSLSIPGSLLVKDYAPAHFRRETQVQTQAETCRTS